MDPAANAVSRAEIGAKSTANKAVIGAADFGKEFINQIFGLKKGQTPPTTEHVEKIDHADKEFSDQAYAATRQKVMAMYEQHRLRRLRDAESKRVAEVHTLNEKNFDKLQQIRKDRQKFDVRAAVAKGSAEVGKNYGSE